MKAYELIQDYGRRCKVAFMATCEGDRPRIRPMATLAVEGNDVYMAAYAASPKMRQLARDPHVELCFMDDQYRHLRVQGVYEMVDDPAMKHRMWEQNESMKEYFDSPDDPEYVLFKVNVQEAMLMEERESYQKLEV